jgi:tetratricopeptide (TPR) repeat protein
MLNLVKGSVAFLFLALTVSACTYSPKKTASVGTQSKSESLFMNKAKNALSKKPLHEIDVTMQVNRADQFYQNGDFSRAEIEYQNLLKLDQNQPIAYYRLGNIAFRNKQFKRAIFYFNKSLELMPRNDKAQYNLAVTYLSLAAQHFKFYSTTVANDAHSLHVERMLAEIEIFSQNDTSKSSDANSENANSENANSENANSENANSENANSENANSENANSENENQSILDELAKQLE